MHVGDLYSLFEHGGSKRDLALYLLDLLVRARFHGARVWTHLQGPFWSGRECDAGRNPDKFGAFGQECATRGLKMLLSQGDMWQPDVGDDTRRRIKDAILHAFPREAIFGCDGGNEIPNNGGADPRVVLDWLQGLPGILSGSTSQSEGHAELFEWSRDPAMVFDEHGSRAGHWWDKLVRIREVWHNRPDDRWLGIQSEGFGWGRRVSVTENMDELTDAVMAFAAVQSTIHKQVHVLFSTAGIYSDDGDRLEDMPGFWSGPKLVQKLPNDVMRFRRVVDGQENGLERVFASRSADTYCDHVMADDGRFVVTLFGPRPDYAPVRSYRTFEDESLQGGQLRMIYGQTT